MTNHKKQKQVEEKKKVLAELQKNSKENLDNIAKHCQLSKHQVRRIVKQLETEGVIWGYTAIVDEGKRDSSQFTILIKKSSKPLDKKIIDKIDSITLEDFVSDMDVTIESSYFVHGKYDWVISITAKDITIVKKFCEALSREFPGVPENIDVLETLYAVRKHYIFNPNRKKLRELM